MAQQKRRYGLIEEPSPFGTLEIWERHLAMVSGLPDDDMLKPLSVARARIMVVRKRGKGPTKAVAS